MIAVMAVTDRADRLELEPWERVQGRQLELFTRQLHSLRRRSPFFRTRLDDAGIGDDFVAREWSDLLRVPAIEKSDIRESLSAHPPLGAHVGVPLGDVVNIQATSGTTGSPSYLGLTREDLETWAEMGARALRAGGIGDGSVVLHAWSMSKGFTGGVPVVWMLHRAGATVVPIGAEAGAERLLIVARDVRPTAMVAAPNFALYLGEQCERVLGFPASELGIRTLVVGGEPGGGIPPIRRRIEETWGATCCEVLGNSDIATLIWAECEARSGMHFVGQDIVLAELLDPDTGEHVAPRPGATAEIVYSALRRSASALLRFKSGDRVEVLDDRCTCGRTSYKIRCFGRTDDMLLVRGINVWPTAVQELVNDFRPRAGGAMQILADFDGHTTQRPLRIKVERAHQDVDAEQLAADLRRSIESRLVFSSTIEVVDPGTIAPPGAAKVALVLRTG
jgi:phenylacetate-CoA ligase